jgi:hypothetical protein
MKNSEQETKWHTEYGIAAFLGVVYIILLGVFTWIFNHSL